MIDDRYHMGYHVCHRVWFGVYVIALRWRLMGGERHYFHGCTRDDAGVYLKNAARGTFVVRPSSAHGSLVISLTQV